MEASKMETVDLREVFVENFDSESRLPQDDGPSEAFSRIAALSTNGPQMTKERRPKKKRKKKGAWKSKLSDHARLSRTVMSMGKFKGRQIQYVPEYYLEWFASQVVPVRRSDKTLHSKVRAYVGLGGHGGKDAASPTAKPAKSQPTPIRNSPSPAVAAEDKWVYWRRLNKTTGQSIRELTDVLHDHGLIHPNAAYPEKAATDKAFKEGYARVEDGQEQWSLGRYLNLVKFDKSLPRQVRKAIVRRRWGSPS